MPISLDPSIKNLPGIGDLEKDSWYRFHGEAGLEDFEKTGVVRAKPDGKYTSTYFSQGTAESRYQPKGKGSVVVAHPSTVEKIPDSRRYGITPQLEKGKDRFQVFKAVFGEGGETTYKSVYDNLSASKYYGRKVAAAAGPVGLAAEGLLYSGEAGAGSDVVLPEDPLIAEVRQRREMEESPIKMTLSSALQEVLGMIKP